MSIIVTASRTISVAPFTGAWIEIYNPMTEDDPITSLPSRERGLKYGVGRLSCG